MNKPDITKEEAGLEQNDRVRPTREPEMSYDENGDRRRPNDLPLRSAEEDRALTDAMNAARGNRRDQQKEVLPKDPIDPNF
jgi:hypothetical protein